MTRLWTCPKCGERCLWKNIEAHKVSDYCRVICVKRARESAGLRTCSRHWLRTMCEAGITPIEDVVHISKGRRYPRDADDDWIQEGIEGYWVPRWAQVIMLNTKGSNRARRVKLLRYLVRNKDVASAFVAAFVLTDWETAHKWLKEEICKSKRKSHNKVGGA